MAPSLPLPTLLSHVLVSHTIELDNEAEHRVPHRTTRGGRGGRRDTPWLVSFVLWANVLQYAAAGAITVATLRERARTTRLLLGGLRRWGYVSVTPPAGEALRNPPQDATEIRITSAGRRAHDVWRALGAVIDGRWRSRFGFQEVSQLERALRVVFDELPFDPPAYLPVVYPTQGGKTEPPFPARPEAGAPAASPGADLSRLLSGVLFAFTHDFETQARISLAISANTLRVLDPTGIPVRDLPRLTGVSKEANAMCAGWLNSGYAVSGPDPTAKRGQVLRLTPKGHRAQLASRRHLEVTEESWRTGFGAPAVAELRAALELLAGDGTLASSPLARGLEPHPDNWRARVRQRPLTLPHHPMALHRGGYPDGS